MKIVIYSQYQENYGAHDWDGTGECPQHWKMKGGGIYVVPNLTVDQTLKVKTNGIPTLTALIEHRSHGSQETVFACSILNDDAKVGEDWETPTVLQWRDGRWWASQTTVNDEYGYMRREIASKHQEWAMEMGGERSSYACSYTMQNGDVVLADGLGQYLEDMKV